MHKSEFINKFSCVRNSQGELVWESTIEARMYVAQNFDAILCSLVEEGGLTRLYEGEIEDNRIGLVIFEAGDHSFPVEGVDWEDVEGADQPEKQEPGDDARDEQKEDEESEESYTGDKRQDDNNQSSGSDAIIEEETIGYQDEESGRGEVVFSADSISDLLAPAKEVDGYERSRFISEVGVEDPEEVVIMDLGLDEVEIEPIEQIKIVDTGRISNIVEFSQDRYNIDIIPNEITNIPLGTTLLRHDSVVIEGKTYYFSRFKGRSKQKIADFIERAVDELAAGKIVVEPLTMLLETPKGKIKTYKYFLSEVQEIAGLLRKYSPKIVGVDGEFQLIIGQYWSL
jgi:hypothetical protein